MVDGSECHNIGVYLQGTCDVIVRLAQSLGSCPFGEPHRNERLVKLNVYSEGRFRSTYKLPCLKKHKFF